MEFLATTCTAHWTMAVAGRVSALDPLHMAFYRALKPWFARRALSIIEYIVYWCYEGLQRTNCLLKSYIAVTAALRIDAPHSPSLSAQLTCACSAGCPIAIQCLDTAMTAYGALWNQSCWWHFTEAVLAPSLFTDHNNVSTLRSKQKLLQIITNNNKSRWGLSWGLKLCLAMWASSSKL